MIDSDLRPWRCIHTGTVMAAALLLPTRERVLASWTPGATVFAFAEGWLLQWPESRPVDVARAPGLVFTWERGLLVAAPLRDSEWDALRPPLGVVLWVEGGRVRAERPREEVDPSEWLDLGHWGGVRGAPLGPPTATIEAPAPEPPVLSHGSFGLPPPLADANLVLDALRRPADPAGPPGLLRSLPALLLSWLRALLRPRRSHGTPPPQLHRTPGSSTARPLWSRPFWFLLGIVDAAGTVIAGVLDALVMPFVRLARWLGAWLLSAPRPSPSPQALPIRTAPPAEPWALSRWLRHQIARSRLSRLLGARQARYLADLLDELRGGDLEEALRRAIPLGAGRSAPGDPLLGLPGRRDSLKVTAGRGGGSSIILADPFFAELRRAYRHAHDRALREGRVEFAAYVLAELLQEDQAAVDLLEREGRLRLAAELAETRDLGAGLVVRLWWEAGDQERALAWALRTDAFADAVSRLERAGRDASLLRVRWAAVLAESGDPAGAARVADPVPGTGARVAAWIDDAMALGGASVVSLLPRRVELDPTSFPQVRRYLEPYLRPPREEGPGGRGEGSQPPTVQPDGDGVRAALASALLAAPPSGENAVLTRMLVRSLLHHPAPGGQARHRHLVAQLSERASDPLLRHDASRSPPPRPPDPTRWRVVLDPDERGAIAVHDALWLPSGDLLLALGELGLRLVRSDGRTVAAWDQPAFRLTLADAGGRALGWTPRDGVLRVLAVDLVQRRIDRPFRIPGDDAATSYDGRRWFVRKDRDLELLELADGQARRIWRIGDLIPQAPIGRTPERLAVVVAPDGEWERWDYSLPDPTLRRRVPVVAAAGSSSVPDPFQPIDLFLDPYGNRVTPRDAERQEVVWWRDGWAARCSVPLARSASPPPYPRGDGEPGAPFPDVLAHPGSEPPPDVIRVHRGGDTLPFGVVEGILGKGRLRAMGDHLLWAGERGRVLVIDRHTGRRRVDFRVGL